MPSRICIKGSILPSVRPSFRRSVRPSSIRLSWVYEKKLNLSKIALGTWNYARPERGQTCFDLLTKHRCLKRRFIAHFFTHSDLAQLPQWKFSSKLLPSVSFSSIKFSMHSLVLFETDHPQQKCMASRFTPKLTRLITKKRLVGNKVGTHSVKRWQTATPAIFLFS